MRVAILAVLFLALAAANANSSEVNRTARGATPDRIVSLAPSITEILFALSAGNKIAGVTDYCDFPPIALKKPKVGGFYNPSYEAIVRLKPDMVILLVEHLKQRKNLSLLGMKTTTVNHKSISGVLNSISTIGKLLNKEKDAEAIVSDIRLRIKRIKGKTENLKKPKVMLALGRNLSANSLEEVYISGGNSYYEQMIKLAGGVNAYTGTVAYPNVSVDGINMMNPEIIIDLIPEMKSQSRQKKKIIAEWKKLNFGNTKRRIVILTGDYLEIPGPRLIKTVEDIARAIHPEIAWDDK